MKPLAGGAIENGTLALRYICSNPNVTIVIPGMAEEQEMEENIKACLDSSPLSQAELDEIRKVREQLVQISAVDVITVHPVLQASVFPVYFCLPVI